MNRRSFLFLSGSARRDGNTDILAREAAAHLPEDTVQRWVRLADLVLPTFVDIRHEGDGAYPQPAGDARLLLDATLAATDIVIASPLYWYSVTAATKLYLDHWSGWMRVPHVDFRARMAGKTMWAITVVSDDDHRHADPLVGTLRLTAEYLRMNWGGTLIGFGNRPGDILLDTQTLAAAKAFLSV